ncbi:MAG: class I SAM-dependent methyltransferase [Candidatus Bathyarchaeota archaeon]|nr:class I SAM-dependent methyltransferase [Candidatus Bathyarchaeota archaeon]
MELKIHNDTFGLYLLDAHRGLSVASIIERDDGHINASPNSTKTYFSSHNDWPPGEQEAISHAHGNVLDVGCGAGRHSLHLQNNGVNVLATDLSPLAVQVTKERGVKNTLVSDVNDLNPAEKYDTVLLLGGNFGIYGDPENTKHGYRHLHTITSDKAVIIASTLNPYSTNKTQHLDYHQQNRENGRMPGLVKLRTRYEQYASPWFHLLWASPEEMKTLLQDTGWQIRHLIEPEKPIYYAILEKNCV